MFAIQRVFNSPTGAEIITNISESFTLNALQNSSIIPDNIQIVPVSKDKNKNNLKSFLKPKSTIVYFYKFTKVNNAIFGFKDNNANRVSSSVMKFNNNGQLMFNPFIRYKNINTVYQKNEHEFTIQYLTTVSSNMNNPSIIDFSILAAAL
jgi:hypothetical protein